jgi:hypothetical protein
MRRAITSNPLLSTTVLASPVLIFLLASTGCDMPPGTREQLREHQEQALQDPMDYSPDMSDTDIGTIGAYNPKAMERDWNEFWNP